MNELQEKELTLEECQAVIAKQEAVIALLMKEIESAKIFENNYIGTKEAAILLDVQPRTIRKYNSEEKITGRKYTKEGRLLFLLIEVLAFRKKYLRHWSFFDKRKK